MSCCPHLSARQAAPPPAAGHHDLAAPPHPALAPTASPGPTFLKVTKGLDGHLVSIAHCTDEGLSLPQPETRAAQAVWGPVRRCSELDPSEVYREEAGWERTQFWVSWGDLEWGAARTVTLRVRLEPCLESRGKLGK